MHEKHFEMMISEARGTLQLFLWKVYTQPRPSNIYNSSFIDLNVCMLCMLNLHTLNSGFFQSKVVQVFLRLGKISGMYYLG